MRNSTQSFTKEVSNKPIKLTFSLDVVLAAAFLLVPIIAYFNKIAQGVNTAWPLFALWFSVILYKNRSLKSFFKLVKQRSLLFFLLCAFLLIALLSYTFLSSSQLAANHIAIYVTYILILLMDCYYAARPLKYRFTLFFIVVFALGVQAMISIPYVINDDSLLIRFYSSGRLNTEESIEAMKHGVGNNGLYSSLPGIVILTMACLRFFTKPIRLILTVFAIAMAISVILSTFLASVFMLFTAFLILLFRYRVKVFKPKVTLTVLVLAVGLGWFYDTYLNGSTLMEPIANKVEKFGRDNNDPTGRVSLAGSSVRTFFDHPFFGVGAIEKGNFHIVGEHMPWVDYLAYYGVFGFMPLLLFIALTIRGNWRFFFINDDNKLYRTACLIGSVIFILSNFISPIVTVGASYTFFLLFYTSVFNREL